MKRYRLLKDLPKCPKGRIFRETNSSNDYFHSITDDELLSNEYNEYKFDKHTVETLSDWFELITEEPVDKSSTYNLNDEVIIYPSPSGWGLIHDIVKEDFIRFGLHGTVDINEYIDKRKTKDGGFKEESMWHLFTKYNQLFFNGSQYLIDSRIKIFTKR